MVLITSTGCNDPGSSGGGGWAGGSDDGCNSVILDNLPVGDSLIRSIWFDSLDHPITMINQAKKKLLYKRSTYKVTHRKFDPCGSTFTTEVHSSVYRTEFLAPDLSVEVFNEKVVSAQSTHTPYIHVQIGEQRLIIHVDDMVADNGIHSQHVQRLDTMGSTFNDCYMYSLQSVDETDVETVIYSHAAGILGYYLKNGFFWRQE